jgi:hypothetical protein
MEPLMGSCHCGNLKVEFEPSMAVGELQLRACQCSFCRKHGARTTTDPSGRAKISAREPREVIRYRFSQGTADFLVCGRCGIYVAAVLSTGNGLAYSTANVNCFDRAEELRQPAARVSYEGESASDRVARRIGKWTPTKLEF